MSMMLDYLRVPMAAPETAGLRTMRELILISCVLIAVALLVIQFVGFDGLRSGFLSIGATPLAANDAIACFKGGLAALILTLAALTPPYVVMKNRADDAHLFALVGRGDDA